MAINRYSILAVSVSLCLSTTALQAAGFGVTVQSASGGGNAATGHAMAEDASVMWYNPALLSSIEGTQINGGLGLLDSELSVVNTGSALPSAGGGTPVIGANSADPGGLAATPSLFYKRDIGDMAFGLGINVPFGVSTDYDKDSFTRYEATESELKTLNINPALSWRINNKLDIGVGASVQLGSATLSRSVDGFLACRRIAGASDSDALTAGVCDALGLGTASNSATDTQVETEATGVAFGANVGLAYRPTPATTISVGYRSEVKYDLDGDADFDHNGLEALGEATLSAAGLNNQDITADLDLPASLSLAFASKVSNRLTLHGDVTWTEWSSVPEIRIVFPDNPNPDSDSVTDLQWGNTIRVGAGLTYQLSEKTKLRAGIAHDPTPTPSSLNRTPRAPRADTMWYSAGMSHQFSEKLSIDGSFSLIDPKDNTINYTAPGSTDYLTRADVETDAFSAALSVNYRFH